MTDDFLPPSPNWYCSQASDVSDSGLFAYATRNVIFLLNVTTNSASSSARFVGRLTGHTSRVTAVKSGSGTHNRHLCASAGDDGSVKVWDVRTMSVLNEHQFHSENKVTAVDWSILRGQNSVLVSGDEKGTLIWWNHVSGEEKEFIPEKQHIYCMAACPHDRPVVAVGYKTGLVLIVCISNKGEIMHRLRGHDEEIHSVCWSPVLGENISLEKSTTDGKTKPNESIPSTEPLSDARTAFLPTLSEQGCLLVSGSRDRTLRVWTTTQGKAVLTLTLPSRGGTHRTRERGDDAVKARVWLAVCWPKDKPREFISSSFGGDLIQWDLSKPGKRKWEYFGLENGSSHLRIVFNISSVLSSPDMFITTSMDRQILCWDIKTQKTIWTLPTLGGFVYSLSACPVDPGCLALGVGDNMIRLWNTSSPGRGSTAVSALWQGIKSKVTALTWHPERDNCLAYGTDDGRVGIYNTFNQGKGPHLSSTFHKKTVYSLDWGPKCPAKEGGSEYCLYSCGGDGILYQHDPARLGEDATNFNNLIRSANQITHMLPLRTDVCWRNDGRVVAIGNEDGSIEIVAASTLDLLCTIQVHRKLINCLKWYPGSNQSETGLQTFNQSAHALEDGVIDSGQSHERFWLASGSNEPQVQVHDLAHVLGGAQLVQIKTPITGAFRSLDGHTLRVTALSWNPHGNSQLVSSSYDGTAQVWDVLKGEPIANFRGHLGRLFSVVWSILDPDVIYSGGEDFCVLKWKVSKVQYTRPPAHKRNTVTMMQRVGKARTSAPAKPNKKKKRTLRDAPNSSTPSESVTPETLTNSECVSQTPHSESKDLTKDKTDHDASLDVMDLKKVIEEKKLEMLKLVSAQEKSSVGMTGERVTEFISAVDAEGQTSTKNEPDDEKEEESLERGEDVGVMQMGTTLEVPSTEAPCIAPRKDVRRKKKTKSLFPLSRSQDNRGKLYQLEDCIYLAQHTYSHTESLLTSKPHAAVGGGILPICHNIETPTKLRPGEGDDVHLGTFADRKAAYAMFREEGNHHDEAGNRDQSQHLNMWKGSLAGTLTKATENNQLNSFLVSMAPLGGYDVWLETAEAYARQLERNEDYTQAATYYLACHKIHKAVAVLRDNKLFREAVALVSVRLSPFDNVFTDVYKTWARHLESEGNYGQAAKCYLAINQPADAVMLLARKSDIPSLSAALRVSYITDQDDLMNSVMVRYLHECLMAGDWVEAQAVLANHKRVFCGSLVAFVHEVIVTMLSHQKLISGESFTEPRTNVWVREIFKDDSQMTLESMDGLTDWMTPFIDNVPLLVNAVEKWLVKCGLDPLAKEALQRLYHEVCSISQQNMQHLPTKQLLIKLAFELALAQLSVMMGMASKAVAHWLRAAVMCCDGSNMDIAKGIFCLILPEGELSIKKIQNNVQTSSTSTADVACLRANYLFTVLYHLWCEVDVSPSNRPEERTVQRSSSTKACDGSKVVEGNCLPSTSEGLPNVGASEASTALSSSVNEGTGELNEKAVVCHTDSKLTFPLQDSVSRSAGNGDFSLTQEDASLPSHKHINRSLQRMDSEETLCTRLSKISEAILSEPRARLKNLQGRLKCIQSTIGDLIYAKERQVADTFQEEILIGTEDPKSSTQELVVCTNSDNQKLSVTQPLVESQTTVPVATSTTNLTVSSNAKQETTSEKLEGKDVCQSSTVVDRNSTQALQTEQQPRVGLDNVTKGPLVFALKERTSEESSLPSNWDEMMADVKYSHPGVTCDLLREEQHKLLEDIEELRREYEVPGPFPDTLEVARMLLHICRAACSDMDIAATDHNKLRELQVKAMSWGHKHSWLTSQQELFSEK